MKAKIDRPAEESLMNSKPFFAPTTNGRTSVEDKTKETFFKPVSNSHHGTYNKTTGALVQPQLIVNEPGDEFEQEADLMAEKVVCTNDHLPSRVQEISPIQMLRKAEPGGNGVTSELANQIENSKGGGVPLANHTLSSMSSAFGADFSGVRVHNDSVAANMCNGINANAFTHGADMYFNQGKYNPQSVEGKKLLGHELTHVVQQNRLQNAENTHTGNKHLMSNVVQRQTPLTHNERVEYRRQTGNRIDRAFTAFVTAVEQNRAAIKDKARQSASFTEMLIEVVFGLAAPGLAGGVVSLARRLPASLAAYQISIAAMDASAVQRVLGAAVRVGREVIRRNSTTLFGDTELDQYAIVLQSQFQQAAQAVDSNLPNLSDQDLLITMAAYDAQVTDVIHYRPIVEDILRRFTAQIEPIGSRQTTSVTDPIDRQIRTSTGVMWVTHSSGPVLVLGTATDGRLRFDGFIDSDLRDAALERGRQLQPRGIQTIPWDNNYIGGLPASVPANVARQ